MDGVGQTPLRGDIKWSWHGRDNGSALLQFIIDGRCIWIDLPNEYTAKALGIALSAYPDDQKDSRIK